MSRPRVLVSAAARAAIGAAWPEAAEAVLLEAAAADATAEVDAAFISRDITGLSTKHQVLAPLADCYAVLRRSSGLRWVHTHAAGADRPIYAELAPRGVAVTTSAGTNAAVVAQTALAGLLALARRFPQLLAAQREARWAPLVAGPLPRDLAGQTVVLVGWGAIAQHLQPLLTLLGLQVVVVRRRGSAAVPGLRTLAYDELRAVLPQADWLVLACPLTPATTGLVDAAALAALPPHAGLVNVARGEVVDEPALIAALQAGRLGGAFLDVFAHEPLPSTSPLWSLPGVITTPHTAGHSDGNAARVQQRFLDNLARWLRGEALTHRVD